jgi:beta-ketodecanoyl-[acyl-carrier-protein] synthase
VSTWTPSSCGARTSNARTALVLERTADALVPADGSTGGEAGSTEGTGERWDVLGTKLATQFSNNIRNDFGFLNESEVDQRDAHEMVFRQNGQMVFREVCPLVATHISAHLESLELAAGDVRRFWLHQANLKMNQLIAKGCWGGRRPTTRPP